MFTGLVQALGIVLASSETAAGKRLTVSLAELADAPIAMGDSVSVSGVCLTVVKRANGNVAFDVVGETLARTTLGKKIAQDRVNLELALQANAFVGGHFVQGHVDAVGTVLDIRSDPADWRVKIRVPAETGMYLVPKGSVTIDGVAMTIAAVEKVEGGAVFTVAVIPATLEKTTFSGLGLGDSVNIETDMLARTVVHYLEQMGVGAGAGAQRGGGAMPRGISVA